MSHHRRIFAFLVIWLALLAASAMAAPGKPIKTQLPNGLTVIIEEEHSAPVVSVQMWVKVGGADEDEKHSGISHVFEHMLFKGTDTKKVGEIATMIESVGGDVNAYTSFDNTVYHLTVPSRYFTTGLDAIGDAIQHSSFDPEELDKELKVVLEEIRMNEDSPERILYRSLLGTAFTTHPYKRPVIGTVKTVEAVTRKDLLRTFRKWYVPNNMTLVIAGDVDAAQTLEAVKKQFKTFKKAPDPHKKRAVEPAQKDVRADVRAMEIKDARLGMAFHIPSMKDEDTFALDVLQIILSGGETSRLVKRIKVDDQLVYGISAYPMSLKNPGLFFVTAVLDAKNIDRTVGAAMEELERLKARGPEYDELKKAKFNIESEFVYSRETMDGIAGKLGYYETLAGDPDYERRYIEGIRKVSADDIKRVLGKYLTASNMTISALAPETDKGAVTEASLTAMVKTASKDAQTMFAKKKEQEDKTTRVILDNGITLIVKEAHANPTVAFYAAFPGGLRFEDRTNNGISDFTAGMLTRGTKSKTREELAKEMEEMAGGVSGFSGWNSTGVSGKFLSMFFDRGLGLLADVIQNPSFPEDEIEKLRVDILASIKRQEDNLPGYTFKLLYKELFPVHPYGMPAIGTEGTIQAITGKDMIEHHEKYFVPGRMVLVIAGDVDTDDAVAKVKGLFKGFGRPAAALPEPPREPRQEGIRRTGDIKDKEQTHIGIGFHGVTLSDEERFPLMVMTEVLSGQGGRLFKDLRDRQSLAYSLTAFLKPGVDPGLIGAYIGTAPEKKEKAIAGIFEELKRIRDERVSEEEMTRARRSLIGGYEINLQDVSSQASDAANNELYGRGYGFYKVFPDKINAVTAEDVQKAARKYLTLDDYTISIVGPNGHAEEKR